MPRYRVLIEYREPTYELRAGTRPEPYRTELEIDATTPDGAVALALHRFHEAERVSSVHWKQVIETIRVDGVYVPLPAEP